MTTLVSNQQNIQPINSAQLVGIFKAIAPRSFEKTFDGMPIEAINNAMKICIEGLSRDEINTGLRLVRDNGFCPDPVYLILKSTKSMHHKAWMTRIFTQK